MGRHQPLEIAKLKRSDRKNPSRYSIKTKKSKLPLGEPPKHLTPPVLEAWKKFEKEFIPGVLTFSDRAKLELLSETWAEWRKKPSEFNASAKNALFNMLSEFGVGALSRQKLVDAADPANKKNKDADFSEFT